MRVYKLIRKDYNKDVIFGLPYPFNTTSGEQKLNKLLSKIKPWKYCIPFYNGDEFAFISSDALLSFLQLDSNLTEEELNDISNNLYIKSFEVSTWCSGLSKILCSYSPDDIKEGTEKEYQIKDIIGWEFKFIYQDKVPSEDVQMTKERFYNNIQTFYK